MLDELIEALQIFRKYGNPECPSRCEHDTMYIMISPTEVPEEDRKRLDELGFFPDYEFGDAFKSYKFGSA